PARPRPAPAPRLSLQPLELWASADVDRPHQRGAGTDAVDPPTRARPRAFEGRRQKTRRYYAGKLRTRCASSMVARMGTSVGQTFAHGAGQRAHSAALRSSLAYRRMPSFSQP